MGYMRFVFSESFVCSAIFLVEQQVSTFTYSGFSDVYQLQKVGAGSDFKFHLMFALPALVSLINFETLAQGVISSKC